MEDDPLSDRSASHATTENLHDVTSISANSCLNAMFLIPQDMQVWRNKTRSDSTRRQHTYDCPPPPLLKGPRSDKRRTTHEEDFAMYVPEPLD
jgi:hypothetical protein